MNFNNEPRVIYECPCCGRNYDNWSNCVACIKRCEAKTDGREFMFCTEVTIDIYYSEDSDEYRYALMHEQHPGYVYKNRPDEFEATDTGDKLTLNAVSTLTGGLDSVRGLHYCYVNDKRIHSDAEIEKMLVEAAKKEFKRISEEI